MKTVVRFSMVVGVCLIPLIATAQVVFHVPLDSTETGSGSMASGTGYVIVSSDLKSATYRFTVNGLSSAITGAHFHVSPSSAVVQALSTFSGNTVTGTWSNIPDSLVKYLASEGVYVNIHTTNFPNGEIRGTPGARQSGVVFDINGTQAGTASTATGTGYMYWISLGGDTVAPVYRITFTGLQGTYSAAHFHSSPSGGIIQAIPFVPGTYLANTTESVLTPFGDSVYAQLLRGNIYVNIHSNTFPAGEIRGNSINAGEMSFVGDADGTQAGTASTGLGTVWAVLSKDVSKIRYSATYNALQGTYSASHFHGASTSVIQGATMTGNHVTGTWNNPTDQHLIDFMRAKVYFNIHSSTFPNGEIRAIMKFRDGTWAAEIDGAQAGTPSAAKGTAWMYISNDGGDAMAYHMTYAGLGSSLTGAHLHIAPGGTITFPLTFTGGVSSGLWNATSDDFVSLIQNNIYVNIHSTNFSSGEIRGKFGLGSYGTTLVELIDPAVPSSFSLEQNFPNPFNPSTKISFALTNKARVDLRVFNVLGQEVAALLNEERIAGTHQVEFNAGRLPSGIYFYRLSVDAKFVDTKKMLLMK